MSSEKRKVTLFQILADPKNRAVSSKFFKFAFLMILAPIGFLLLSLKIRLLSMEASAVIAVLMVNVIMGVYAMGAYREEAEDYKQVQTTKPIVDKKKD
jgi:hypothetical protein